MGNDESFSSEVEVTVDGVNFGKARLTWSPTIIYRGYGIASLSPSVYAQKIDLSKGHRAYFEENEDTIKEIKEAQAKGETLSKWDKDSLVEYEKLKELENIEVISFEVEIELNGGTVTSLGLVANELEINSKDKTGIAKFGGNSV